MEIPSRRLIAFRDLPLKVNAPIQKRGRTLPGARTSVRFVLLAALMLSFLPALTLYASPPPGYYLVWSDEFNSHSLDRNKWDFWLLGHRRNAINVTNAISLDGSNLVITTYTSNKIHYTGFVATDETFRARYGYWESRLRWSDTNGMWSAFWLQSPEMISRSPDSSLSGSEIDIAEHRFLNDAGNHIANQIQVNIHWNGYGRSARSSGSGNVASGLADDFHTYGFLWTPDSYSFLVDGEKIYNGGSAPISHSTAWTIFSSEVDDTSTLWAGHVPPEGYGSLADSSTKLLVDYVRYYAPTNVLFWTGADSDYWTNSANWVSNRLPDRNCDLTFGSLSQNSNSVLGADTFIHGLVVLQPPKSISIAGSHTLTIDAGGIDLSAADKPARIDAPVKLSAAQTWSVGKHTTLTLHGSLTGDKSLTKTGAGSLALESAKDFFGNLKIDAGTLEVRGPLALSGSLTLSSNSTLFVEIEKKQNTRTQLKVSGSFRCDGTLSVTNLGGALAAGDSFKLFEAGSFSGTFQNLLLPPLPADLEWRTQNLTNGFLSVAAIAGK